MPDFVSVLFDTSDFPPRWHCGKWTEVHGWTHIVSDLGIWGAYMAIPILIAIAARRRRDIAFPKVLWLFVAFILACGTTHLLEAVIFWHPVYRIAAIAKAVTAVVSWATVTYLMYYGPQILRLPSITEVNLKLEKEVAQRRKAESELVRQAEVLQLALSAGQIGTYQLDLRTRRSTVDAGLNRIFGLSETGGTRRVEDYQSRIHPDDRGVLDRVFRQIEEPEGEYHAEFRIVRPDGAVRWVRDRGKVVRGSQGESALMTGATVDITDIRRAEESMARLAAIVETSSDAIISQSLDGEILTWNAAAERTFGHTADEVIGQSIEIIVPAEYREELARYRAAVKRGEKIAHFETVRQCKDGRRIDVWLAVSPIQDHAGRVVGLSAVERDITERKRHDAQLRRLNAELQAKSAEMEQFAYIVSHDLKSPLVTMLGFVGLLREDLGENVRPEVTDGLNRIGGAATRMSQLIDDLLELSRVGRVKDESRPVDLETLVDQLRQDLAEEFHRVGAELIVERPLAAVHADPRRLQQVLQNLLTNAVKYGCTRAEPKIWVSAEQRAGGTRIGVRDNGPGINAAHHERIFRLFEQAEPGQGGTGVGLALIAKIVQAHGGRCGVDSSPGNGAAFWVEFPNEPRGGDAGRGSSDNG